MTPIVLSGAEYLALPRLPETFILRPLLPAGGSLTIYGDPKVGKSYAALQLGVALVSGREWLGFPVPRNGPVTYVQLDTPRSLWAQRLDDLRSQGVEVERLNFCDRETLGTWPFDIMRPDHQGLLREVIEQSNPMAVIIDTLKESHQLPENDNTEMQKVIAGLEAAVRPAALILVHHGKKPNPDQPSSLIHGARGAGYLTGKMDSLLHMSKKTLSYTGRAIEEGSFRIERLDTGFWQPLSDETDRIIEAILSQPGSLRQHAKELGARINRSEEAARSLIRRWKAANPTPGQAQTRLVRGGLTIDPTTGEIIP